MYREIIIIIERIKIEVIVRVNRDKIQRERFERKSIYWKKQIEKKSDGIKREERKIEKKLTKRNDREGAIEKRAIKRSFKGKSD